MAARTTDAEEQELRRLLRSGDIPESLRDIAVLFEGFDALSEEQYPDERAGKRPDALAVSRELSRVEVHPLAPTERLVGSCRCGGVGRRYLRMCRAAA